MSKQEHHATQTPTRRRVQDINVNPFDLLYNEPKCYVCHNFGHKASKCYLKDYKAESRVNGLAERKVWKKKESHECGIVISIQRQKDPWYIDSVCSKHMIGDKSKFLSLREHK